jgi:hypothetical protein
MGKVCERMEILRKSGRGPTRLIAAAVEAQAAARALRAGL